MKTWNSFSGMLSLKCFHRSSRYVSCLTARACVQHLGSLKVLPEPRAMETVTVESDPSIPDAVLHYLFSRSFTRVILKIFNFATTLNPWEYSNEAIPQSLKKKLAY